MNSLKHVTLRHIINGTARLCPAKLATQCCGHISCIVRLIKLAAKQFVASYILEQQITWI